MLSRPQRYPYGTNYVNHDLFNTKFSIVIYILGFMVFMSCNTGTSEQKEPSFTGANHEVS